ncbi:zinc finger, CCCH-type [Artemisia annua]|uniref:Zinc finger, CCCH-type n=1 Tax=Artemisia annua TaxID=35608 RepID=A0A2U1N3H8_ARTAN|nr:zinc finger, CCCH-type [Artemisia annua]
MNMQQFQSRILNCLAFITNGTCFFGKFCRFNHLNPAEVLIYSLSLGSGCYQSGFGDRKLLHKNTMNTMEDRQRGMSRSSPTPCKICDFDFDKFGKMNGLISNEQSRYDSDTIHPTENISLINIHDDAVFLCWFCMYGASCRFSHALPVVLNLQLHFNALGLPKRLIANTCSFYMLNGIYGYGVACKCDHPEPVNHYPHQGDGSYVVDEVEEYQNALDGNTYEWNGDENQVSEYHGVTNGGNGNGSQYVQQPEPVYYPTAESREYQNEYHGVTNGGNVNQYHQNPNAAWNGNQQDIQARTDVISKESFVTLIDARLPLRPGKRVCRLYESLGLCKYGRRCKFDHPLALSSKDEGSSKPISSGETPNAQE